MKILKLLTPYILILLLSFNCFAEKKKVALIAGFSGPWSTYGQAYLTGLNLANKENNYEIIVEDDQFTPAKTVALYHKLAAEKGLEAIIVGDTVTGSAIAPLAKKYKIPTLIWASKEPIFLNNPYVFRQATDRQIEFEITSKIFNSKASGSLAVFVHPHNYAAVWGKEVHDRYNSKDKYLNELPFTQQDFKTQLLKAKNDQIKNLAICLNPGDNGTFIKQMQQINYQAKVFACNFIEAKADLEAIKNYPETIYFFSPDLSEDFLTKYKELVPQMDHLVSVATMYDAGIILNLAFNNQSELSLRDKIAQISDYQGAHVSSQMILKDGDQYLLIPTALFEINKGKISKSNK